MFDINDSALDREICYTTIGHLPHYVEPKQIPTKKSPFSAFSGHPFVHSTELILPEEIYQTVWDTVSSKISSCQYAKVFMSLADILEGDFFNKYLKTGNILLISEGRSGVDKVYSLRNGMLGPIAFSGPPRLTTARAAQAFLDWSSTKAHTNEQALLANQFVVEVKNT
ncbi:predicted protein [Uncinocarpus reesii 1704]|uniref:Uncharacterized protein n=1 Tax=Uncinocarpus reesii (strain UAMH 1704) TaxID=336963 RepID=C4JQZ9_UNCRE|nr:uncharacterized protein UREG_03481 [Uncinocarpus reesii 1704]EEP78635.1 predicted protein [Uncinocarpus reesii 1704]